MDHAVLTYPQYEPENGSFWGNLDRQILLSRRARVGITTLSPIRRRFYDALRRTLWKNLSRPGGPGGRLFYLRECWATALFAAFFAWSVRDDRRYFKTLDERLDAALATKAAAKAAAKAQGGPGQSAPPR